MRSLKVTGSFASADLVDVLSGGVGDDLLIGGEGNDSLDGGAGISNVVIGEYLDRTISWTTLASLQVSLGSADYSGLTPSASLNGDVITYKTTTTRNKTDRDWYYRTITP